MTFGSVWADKVTVSYAIEKDETHTAGESVEVKNGENVVATLTFGVTGGADFKPGKAHGAIDGFTAYTEGNGQNGKPDEGTVYYIEPTQDGTIEVGVVLNAGKGFYVLEDGTALEDFNGITVDEKKYGTFSFPVSAGKKYAVYAAGTKLGFYGFKYTFETQQGGGGEDEKPEIIPININYLSSAIYAVAEGDIHAAGESVDITDGDKVIATLTFGVEGGAEFKPGKAHGAIDGFTAFTEGNGENGKPDEGTVYYIEPTQDGTIEVGVVLNAGKGFYVLEDGTALEDFNGITVDEKKYGTFSFPVSAGKKYAVYAAGTKLGFYGIKFNYNSANYATLYYGSKALIVPSGIKAYTATATDGKIVPVTTYNEGAVIPAGEAVIIEGAAGSYDFVVEKNSTATPTEGNSLYGTDNKEETVGNGKFYKLASKNGVVGFYYGAEDGAAFENGAHKAYLVVSEEAAAKFYVFAGQATGINAVSKVAVNNGAIYNLQGVRVNSENLTKGIYVVNGKKYVIK